jgi:5'-nucleotidase
MDGRPLILITNDDDGLDSPGLAAAAEAVADLGELLLAAPATQQTSMSGAFVTGPAIGAVQPREVSVNGATVTGYAVTGMHVQAVAHALIELAGRPPSCASAASTTARTSVPT